MTQRVEQHVAAFNQAVETGRWDEFGARFSPGARMTFVGAPGGPFEGRAAIVAAYQENPPTDTMKLLPESEQDGTDGIRFEWSKGGRGTMRLRWAPDGKVTSLEITFDD